MFVTCVFFPTFPLHDAFYEGVYNGLRASYRIVQVGASAVEITKSIDDCCGDSARGIQPTQSEG